MKNIIGNIDKLRDIKEELARIDKYKYPYAYNALLMNIISIQDDIIKLQTQIKGNGNGNR